MENRVLKELGVTAIKTIEKMDEEIEYKDNKINVLQRELKDVNSYDEEEINALLNKNPAIRYVSIKVINLVIMNNNRRLYIIPD
jgi:hypothetical protein